jgi:hypothetical protein
MVLPKKKKRSRRVQSHPTRVYGTDNISQLVFPREGQSKEALKYFNSLPYFTLDSFYQMIEKSKDVPSWMNILAFYVSTLGRKPSPSQEIRDHLAGKIDEVTRQ